MRTLRSQRRRRRRHRWCIDSRSYDLLNLFKFFKFISVLPAGRSNRRNIIENNVTQFEFNCMSRDREPYCNDKSIANIVYKQFSAYNIGSQCCKICNPLTYNVKDVRFCVYMYICAIRCKSYLIYLGRVRSTELESVLRMPLRSIRYCQHCALFTLPTRSQVIHLHFDQTVPSLYSFAKDHIDLHVVIVVYTNSKIIHYGVWLLYCAG